MVNFSIATAFLEKYEKKYKTQVTKKTETHRRTNKLTPTQPEFALYEQKMAVKFWCNLRGQLKDYDLVSSLRKRMKERRQNKVISVLRQMDFDRNGEFLAPQVKVYLKRRPLLGDSERDRKKRRITEDVWDVHRSLCTKLPFCTVGFCSTEAADAFEVVSQKVRRFFYRYDISPEQDSNHFGYPMANTVVTGARGSNKLLDISGSVYWGDLFTERAQLRLQIEYIRAIRDVIVSAFGHDNWFIELNQFLRNHSNQFFADRLLPDLPITHLWLSTRCTPNNIHKDERNAFIAFLMVPFTVAGGELVITDPDVKVHRAIHMKKGMVLAGRCFQCNHYNLALSEEGAYRESVAGYFDYRIGCDRFHRKIDMPLFNE